MVGVGCLDEDLEVPGASAGGCEGAGGCGVARWSLGFAGGGFVGSCRVSGDSHVRFRLFLSRIPFAHPPRETQPYEVAR